MAETMDVLRPMDVVMGLNKRYTGSKHLGNMLFQGMRNYHIIQFISVDNQFFTFSTIFFHICFKRSFSQIVCATSNLPFRTR